MTAKYFQALDDKEQCVGIYKDGTLHFDNFPENCLRTWRYSGSLKDENIEYGWLYAAGDSLEEVCPSHLKEQHERLSRKMNAFRKSFDIAKINFRDHCFYDLVPHDFLIEFLELKNQITEHVFESYEKPANYEFLVGASKLLHKIRYQELNVNNEGCKSLFLQHHNRSQARQILEGSHYIDYKLFGTVTGRLATHGGSFPILTLKKEFRNLIKPKNDWFLSFDYNGAEARTVIALLDHEQPEGDIHEWNMENVLNATGNITREEAKTLFFSWLYNHVSSAFESEVYDREALVEQFYIDGYVHTPLGRKIKIDERRAFNYLIQSTTADLVLERSMAIDRYLSDKKSYISHLIHDEVVIDLCDDEREIVPELKKIFAQNSLDTYEVNVQAGETCYELGVLRL